MPRRPKAKNTLSAGERAAIYEAELAEKQRKMRASEDSVDNLSVDKRLDVSDTVVSDSTLENVDAAATEENDTETKKAKRTLPKPEKAVVSVDFSLPVGEIKPLHGMCNGPVSYGADLTEEFREIGVPFVRFDGTDTAMSSYAIDISRIFKDPDADPADEENYDFSVTDKYVEAALLSGARIIYRLGESRDYLGNNVKAWRIKDIDALCRICVNIIRHFNDRFAGGYEFGIEYFELWNLDVLGDKNSDAENYEIYKRLAHAIKLYDEKLKVGGISCRGFGGAKDFLKYCVKNHVPIDFVTVDLFVDDVERIGRDADKLTEVIEKNQLDNFEIIIGKWMYCPQEICGEYDILQIMRRDGVAFRDLRRKLYDEQRGIKGAAFAAAVLSRLDQTRGVRVACCFDAQPSVSPFCSVFGKNSEKEKPYYSLEAYGKLYRAGQRVFSESHQYQGAAHTGIFASAALSDTEGWVMIASYGGCGTVDLRLDGIPDNLFSADVYMLDGVKNMTLGDSIPLSGMKKRLVFNVSEYGVVLVKLY